MVKKNQILILSVVFCFLFSCNNRNRIIKTKKLTSTDSIWIDFARAMENKNIDYLLINSLDSIKCTECNMQRGIGYQKENHIYSAEVVFRQRISELMHIDSLTQREFNTAQINDLIYVNYVVKSKRIIGTGYNLIFIFKKTKNGYKFTGMTMT